MKAGATVVPLNILFKSREVAYHLQDSDARALFCFEGTPELPMLAEGLAGFRGCPSTELMFVIGASPTGQPVEEDGDVRLLGPALAEQSTEFETIETDDDDTAVILYTSGTTGQPKGAELRHRNMRQNALAGTDLFGMDPARPDTYLCVLPLFHSFGQTVIHNASFAFGCTVVMQTRFEPNAALELLLREKVTFFAGVPTMYWGLLGSLTEATDVETIATNLRIAVVGGAALSVDLHSKVRERFGVEILEGYGLSETSPVASFCVLGTTPKVGSIGRPIPGVEMKLLGVSSWDDVADEPGTIGEIAIRGHNVMKGYYRRPEATAEVIKDGWFRSGDLARRDEDGHYFIVDRSKDMIIRGGFNVYPREIEEVLMTHPAVSLAAVIGVPHPTHGEEIKAVVVLEPGQDLDPATLVDWSRDQMASYKYPRVVDVVAALPMTATGKILKRELE
ncbi:AMP-binding protein [Phycicoccus sp. Soil803]|uniref:AMP-binding protein n=1 Tax=Phycicoccus sp. Soil803 TaxID=1736415 RepID=UPI0021019629|nr:AMP-binding protein [Phycicoccus sp. Soil803]